MSLNWEPVQRPVMREQKNSPMLIRTGLPASFSIGYSFHRPKIVGTNLWLDNGNAKQAWEHALTERPAVGVMASAPPSDFSLGCVYYQAAAQQGGENVRSSRQEVHLCACLACRRMLDNINYAEHLHSSKVVKRCFKATFLPEPCFPAKNRTWAESEDAWIINGKVSRLRALPKRRDQGAFCVVNQ